MSLENGSKDIIEKAKLFVKELFEKEVSKKYSYHNFDHTLEVFQACKKLADDSGLKDEDKEILLLSSLFHDTGFSVSVDDHEEHSQNIAAQFLSSQNYDEARIKRVVTCIGATRMTAVPVNELEKLLKDADLCGLSSENYFEHAELIRQELNNISDEKISKNEWRKTNIEFFKNYTYYSDSGKKLFGPKKKENQKSLEAMIEEKKEKKKKLLTIASSKSAQTQFKTALRNHIDLSAIADNKANIMLSVNALIITVATPILAEKIIDLPSLLYPTISLLIVSVTSMIFATLATRPIKMKGSTTLDDVREKRSNLFFFGNFFKMKFSDYEEGIQQVVAENKALDNSITRDLFFLGKALGSKYSNLRWCYNVFMYGIIFTVVLFLVTIIVQNS